MSVFAWTTATLLAATAPPELPAPPTTPPLTAPAPAGSTPPAVSPPEPSPTASTADPAPPPVEPQPLPLPLPLPQPQPLPVPPGPPATHPDIIVTGERRPLAPDPLASLNAASFAATDAVDKALIGPVALAYKHNIPGPVRDGVHNFLYNMREPVVFANFLLQHKIGKAVETAARFGINTVAGIAGVFDIARRRPFRLPRRSNGFANTLGFYGVPNGLFMFLPIVGPTTVRDLFGGAVDRLVMPFTYGRRITRPVIVAPLAALGVLDHRAEFDDTLRTLHEGTASPYANSRDFYLQRRQAEVDHLRGRDRPGYTPMSEAPKGPIKLRGRILAPPPATLPQPQPQPKE